MKRWVFITAVLLAGGCESETDENAPIGITPVEMDVDSHSGADTSELQEEQDATEVLPDTAEEEPAPEVVEAVQNQRFIADTEWSIPGGLLALAESEGAFFGCGADGVYAFSKEQQPTQVADVECDSLTAFNGGVITNDKSENLVWLIPPDGAASSVQLPEGQRSFSLSDHSSTGGIVGGLGNGGLFFLSSDGVTLTIYPSEGMGEVLAVESLGAGEKIAVGTRTGLAVLDGVSFEVIETRDVLSGVTDIGIPSKTPTGDWELHFLNPLGIGTAKISADGSIQSVPEVLDTVGSHPVRLGSNAASLWSELIVFDPASAAENSDTLVVRGRHSLLQTEESRSVYRHYTDVHRMDSQVIASHDAGVSFFSLEEQAASPDIHSQYTVLKMYTAEPGGTTSAIAVLLNLGEAPLEISSIETTNPAFTLIYDPGPDAEASDVIVVEPGGSTYFEVAFDGSVDSAATALRVTSNDPDEEVYELTARVNHPNMKVGDSLSSALVPDGKGRYRTLGEWAGTVKYIKLFNGL